MAAGITPLHFCIFRGSQQQAIELIEKEDTDLNAGDKSGMTPIHMACYKDNVEIATRLLEAGADGRKPDGGGNTPLHAAAGAGAMKVVQYLAGEGLSIDALNAQGLTPLEVAKRHCPPRQRLSVIKTLQEIVDKARKGDDRTVAGIPESKAADSNDVTTPAVAGIDTVAGGQLNPAAAGVRQFPLRVARRLDVVEEEEGDGADRTPAESAAQNAPASRGGDGGGSDGSDPAVDGRALLRLMTRQQETIDLQLKRQQDMMDLLIRQRRQGTETTASVLDPSVGQHEESKALIQRIKTKLKEMEDSEKERKQKLFKDVQELVKRKEQAAFTVGVGVALLLGITVVGIMVASRARS